MARKKKKEEHENHERWLVSYADFITLLFAFFTTLYAVSNVDAQKYGRMVLSLQAAFDSSVFPAGSRKLNLAPPSPIGKEQPGILDSIRPVPPDPLSKKKRSSKDGKDETLAEIKNRLEAMIQNDKLGGKLRLILDRRGLIIRLAEVGFYHSGSSTVKPEAISIIDQLATFVAPLNHAVRIEGHTDNVPIRTSRYPSNWELSTARATNIVIYLQEHHGLDPQRLSASGYGEFRPLVPNTTTENRALNRRVDIILLSDEAVREEPSPEARPSSERIPAP